MAATITLTLDQLAGELRAQGEVARKVFNSQATRKKIALLAISGVKDHFNQSQSPDGVPWAALRIRPGKPLLDTGRLRAATTAVPTSDGVQLVNNSVQAGLMQSGGTIRPKRGKYLAIPLTVEAHRAGSPRSLGGLHFQGRKGANKGVLVDEQGEAQFALVASVTVPARPFLGFSLKTLERIERTIGDDIAKAIGG